MKNLIISAGIMLATLVAAGNAAQAQEQHKKISDQGKGAIIGGAGGAVAGGLIGHGLKGALIGGAIGAGGGYIVGNEHRKHEVKEQRATERAAYLRERRRHVYAANHHIKY
ncbi:MAG: hypothetical protein NVSMB24_16870 [Mucilaginibacter sp.]